MTVFSSFGVSFSALFVLGLAGCPPSFHEPCRGLECGLREDDAGREAEVPHGPSIASVIIEGNPSRTIRQGFGGTARANKTTVHLTGERLDEATAVNIAAGPNALEGDIISKTPNELSFTVLVRHGAPIGSYRLNLSAPSGVATFADALDISAITAAPDGSDSLDMDLGSTGTLAHPLRSLTMATRLAAAGDTVILKNGTYDMAHGEIFPRGPSDWNVPNDVTLKGESRDRTLLQGPGKADCGAGTALALEGSARIEDLGIAGFCDRGISAQGNTTIRAVTIRDAAFGVSAGMGAVLDSVDISGADIAVMGAPTVINGRVHHNRSGIDAMFAGSSLLVIATEIDHNCPPSLSRPDGAIIVNSAATLIDVKIHDNQCSGVNAPYGLTGQLDITGGVFSANTTAITFNGQGRVKIRSASFDRERHAIHLGGGPSTIDLGSPESPGDNVFTLCDTCDTIFDGRPAPSSGRNPITLKGNIWIRGADSIDIPSGCWDTDYPKDQTAPPRLWHIEHPGSCRLSTGNVIVN